MKKLRFSLVVPVFGNASGLQRCLDSIARQIYQNYELILIENAACGEVVSSLCRGFQRRRPETVLLEQDAEGNALAACSAGLEKATGDYVVFLAVSDCLDPRWLEEINGGIGETRADICFCAKRPTLRRQDGVCFRGDQLHCDFKRATRLCGDEARRFFQGGTDAFEAGLFHAFRRQFLREQSIAFNQAYAWAGDWDFFYQALAKMQDGVLMHYPGYLRFADPDAARRALTKTQLLSAASVHEKWYDFANARCGSAGESMARRYFGLVFLCRFLSADARSEVARRLLRRRDIVARTGGGRYRAARIALLLGDGRAGLYLVRILQKLFDFAESL